jgi:ketosteroid isomerase-like protein
MVLLLAMSLILPAAAQESGAAEVKQADRDFCKATRKKGLEGWVSFFAEDAVISQFKPPAQGREGVRKAYEPLFASRDLDFQWTPQHAEVFPAGNLGYTTGRYTLAYTGHDGTHVKQTGSYLTVWRKQADGSWKVIADFGAQDPKKPAATAAP